MKLNVREWGHCFFVDNQVQKRYLKPMPRQTRIDGPGPLRHILIRGIEQRGIFEDDKGREDFPERLSILLQEMVTPCCA